MHLYKKIVAFTLFLSIYGCATRPPPFVMLAGVPTATISTNLSVLGGRRDNAGVYVGLLEKCDKKSSPIQELYGDLKAPFKVQPEKQVPANRPIRIIYVQNHLSETGTVSVDVTLKEGQKYILTGGFEINFIRSSKCSLGVLDLTSGNLLPTGREDCTK